MIHSMKLYIKRGCPWCVMAESWLRQNGVAYEVLDVLVDANAFAEMRRISGQSKAPVLVTEEGKTSLGFRSRRTPWISGSLSGFNRQSGILKTP